MPLYEVLLYGGGTGIMINHERKITNRRRKAANNEQPVSIKGDSNTSTHILRSIMYQVYIYWYLLLLYWLVKVQVPVLVARCCVMSFDIFSLFSISRGLYPTRIQIIPNATKPTLPGGSSVGPVGVRTTCSL